MYADFSKYLTKTVSFKQQQVDENGEVNYDAYGEAVFEDAIEIVVRMNKKVKRVIDQYGSNVLATQTILTIDDVNVGDCIDDIPVICVEELVDRVGDMIAKKVYI